jgi:hypothetical protein
MGIDRLDVAAVQCARLDRRRRSRGRPLVAAVTIRIGNWTCSGIRRDQLPMWRKLVAEPQGLRLVVVR